MIIRCCALQTRAKTIFFKPWPIILTGGLAPTPALLTSSRIPANATIILSATVDPRHPLHEVSPARDNKGTRARVVLIKVRGMLYNKLGDGDSSCAPPNLVRSLLNSKRNNVGN